MEKPKTEMKTEQKGERSSIARIFHQRQRQERTQKKGRSSSIISLLSSKSQRIMIWIALSIILTLFVNPAFISRQKVYKIGEIAPKNIKSPRDLLIEDVIATEKKRKQAGEEAWIVLDFDHKVGPELFAHLKKIFTDLNRILVTTEKRDNERKNKAIEETYKQRIAELKTNFSPKLNKQELKYLYARKFSPEIADWLKELLDPYLKRGIISNTHWYLIQERGGFWLRDLSTGKIYPKEEWRMFYNIDEAKDRLSLRALELWPDKPLWERKLLSRIGAKLLLPNLILNRELTEEKKKEAIKAVKPVYYQIKKGEMVVREGERITPVIFSRLQAIQSEKKERWLISMIGTFLLILSILFILYHALLKEDCLFCSQNGVRDLLFWSLCLILVAISVKLFSLPAKLIEGDTGIIAPVAIYYGIPVALGAMLVSIFLGYAQGIFFALVSGILSALMLGNSLQFALYFSLSSIAGAYLLRDFSERGKLIKSGLGVGLVQVVLIIIFTMTTIQAITLNKLWEVLFGLGGGLLAGVMVAGFIPLIEMLFGYDTNIKLLELANLNQPLLKELMIKAPGTYHHSIIVGSMVEAAATAIGANPLLARVGAYYHDIGKIKKPQYFVENQEVGNNRHEKLAPSMSSLILISHVKDGVELAKKNRLGKAIIDIIQQHHGTSLIKYFYQKALKAEEQAKQSKKSSETTSSVNIEDFRYPGPKPRSREAALVLMADTIEAASKTLVDPTPSRVQGMVQKMINQLFSDGQLDESQLTLRDLHLIAKSFNKILNGIFHHRVEYPEPVVKTAGKAKTNGNTDRQPSKASSAQHSGDSEEDKESLRRLGLS